MKNKNIVLFFLIIALMSSPLTCFAGTTTLKVVVPEPGCNHIWIHYTINAGYLKHGKQYDKCVNCGEIRNIKKIAGYCSPAAKSVKIKKGKKSFTVKWKKYNKKTLKKLTGYQIRYSLYSSMQNSKYVNVKKTKKSKKIKAKSKKKYYVQIRTYRTLMGDVYYSSWSKRKSVKPR